MTTITAAPASHVIADAVTMLRRNLLHIVRYPGLSMFTILGPVVILLLTVFVFGGTLGAGLPGVDAAALAAAHSLLADSVPDDAGLTLSVPSTGGVDALRAVLDRLGSARLEVDDLSIHTPDLDDVFFALTGKKGNS